MPVDPYQTLGISPTATLPEARAAWLQRVRVLHPDRFDPVKQKSEWDLSTQMLQDVNAAWESIRKGGNFSSNRGIDSAPSSDRRTPPPPQAPQSPTREKMERQRAFSVLAITSFVLTLLGLFFLITGVGSLLFIGAIVLAHAGKSSIRKHGYRGRWMATFSLWTGYLVWIGILTLLAYLWATNLQKRVVADYQISHPTIPSSQVNPSDGTDTYKKSPITSAPTAPFDPTMLGAIPVDSKYYNNQGNVLFNKGDFDGAITDYDKAINLNLNDAVAYYNRGIAKLNKGDAAGASRDETFALKLNPKYQEAFLNRAVAQASLGNFNGAISDDNMAVTLYPNSALAYYGRALVQKQMGREKDALADYSKAIELNPKYSDAYNDRGLIEDNLGDHDGAIADYNQVMTLSPTAEYPYYNRGRSENLKGDYDGAFNDETKSIQMVPNDKFAYAERGLSQFRKGDLDGALTDYNTAIGFDPNNAWFYTLRSKVKQAKGDHDGAVADTARASFLSKFIK